MDMSRDDGSYQLVNGKLLAFFLAIDEQETCFFGTCSLGTSAALRAK